MKFGVETAIEAGSGLEVGKVSHEGQVPVASVQTWLKREWVSLLLETQRI